MTDTLPAQTSTGIVWAGLEMSGSSIRHTDEPLHGIYRHESIYTLQSRLTLHMSQVLDLPQLHTQPLSYELLAALELLKLQLPAWTESRSLAIEGEDCEASQCIKILPHGVTQYLTNIISSPLTWIVDEDEREKVWNTAAARLAERAGRTGMGAMNRTFRIPLWKWRVNATGVDPQASYLDIDIHEPSLTGDRLGLKTWASAFVLARKDELFEALHRFICLSHPAPYKVLELGAGTGLVGMTIAAMLGAQVVLSDLGDIVLNLARNVDRNEQVIRARGGATQIAKLDWRRPDQVEILTASGLHRHSSPSLDMPLVVAADPIYDPEQPAWLARTIQLHLSRSKDARAVVAIAMRDGFQAERLDFAKHMLCGGLTLDGEEFDRGFDDWSGATDGERVGVECWTTTWKWDKGSQFSL